MVVGRMVVAPAVVVPESRVRTLAMFKRQGADRCPIAPEPRVSMSLRRARASPIVLRSPARRLRSARMSPRPASQVARPLP
jgi:hypothetical protein